MPITLEAHITTLSKTQNPSLPQYHPSKYSNSEYLQSSFPPISIQQVPLAIAVVERVSN